MVWVVGLTGGIGSGKSTVADLFSQFGVPIIDTDLIARTLVVPGTAAYQAIVKHFGPSCILEDEQLNRRWIRAHIFNDATAKIWLENLLHPLIKDTVILALQKVSYQYCILVIPLLQEQYIQYKPILSHILLVETTLERQLQFAQSRDNTTEADIQQIIAAQATSRSRHEIADTILENNGDLEDLKTRVAELHRLFLKNS